MGSRQSVSRRFARRLQLDVIGARDLVRSLPSAGWLCIIVAVSTLVYASYGATIAAPVVFADELTHMQLTRAVADGNLSAVHNALFGFGVVAALVGALPLRLGGDMEHGYAFLKAFDSLVMSLAAVPAYFIARRMVRSRLAVLVAGLTVAVPSMVFTALVMRESVFYPLFLCVVLVIVRALEQPTTMRQIGALLAVGAAYVTRPQAIIVLVAYLAAIPLKAWLDSRVEDAAAPPVAPTLRRYAPTVGILAFVTIALATTFVARGRSPMVLLGSYSGLATSYSPATVVRWMFINLADLDLYLGVVGCAGFVLGCARGFDRRAGRPGERAFVAAAVPLAVVFLIEIGAFSTTPLGGFRIHDRNLFCLVPLFLVGTVAWIEQGLPRPRRLTLLVAASVALLPALIPFDGVVGKAWVDQIGIVAWVSTGMSSQVAVASMVGVGLVGAALVLLVPRAFRWLLLGAIVLAFGVTGTAARWQGQQSGRSGERHPTWVEEAVGGRVSVTVLFVDPSGCSTRAATRKRWIAFWRAEFFNPSLAAPVSIGTAPPDSTGPAAQVGRSGSVILAGGQTLSAGFLLLDERLPLRRGVRVAVSRQEQLALWRVDGEVSLLAPSGRRARDFVCGNLHSGDGP